MILRVHAEDGDKGVPREIIYGLVSEGNPFIPFFNISETTGKKILNFQLIFISHVFVMKNSENQRKVIPVIDSLSFHLILSRVQFNCAIWVEQRLHRRRIKGLSLSRRIANWNENVINLLVESSHR